MILCGIRIRYSSLFYKLCADDNQRPIGRQNVVLFYIRVKLLLLFVILNTKLCYKSFDPTIIGDTLILLDVLGILA